MSLLCMYKVGNVGLCERRPTFRLNSEFYKITALNLTALITDVSIFMFMQAPDMQAIKLGKKRARIDRNVKFKY